MYGIPVYSAMMKAAAPIRGGMIWPPVDAEASAAAANSGLNPDRFIIGMVNDPEVTVFATELPEIIPCNPLAVTAALAVPPVNVPVARTRGREELPYVRLYEQHAEEQEQVDKRRGDLYRGAENGACGKERLGRQPVPGEAGVGEDRQVVPEEAVEQRGGGDDHYREPDAPARGFEYEDNAQGGYYVVQRRVPEDYGFVCQGARSL